MKPKFSLRFFVALFTLIAIALGAREAIRTYRWHRNLPVALHIQSQQRESREISLHVKATFDRAEIERVQKAAAEQREAITKASFDDLVNNANDRFYQDQGYYRSALFDYGPKLRRSIQDRVRKWFFRNLDLSVPTQFELFVYLLETNDPAAVGFLSAEFSKEQPDIELLVRALNNGWFYDFWFADHEKFSQSLVDYLKRDQISESFMEWLKGRRLPKAGKEIVKILSDSKRIALSQKTLAELEALGLSPSDLNQIKAAENLGFRMDWIGAGAWSLSSQQAVAVLQSLAEEAKQFVDTPAFDSADLKIRFIEAMYNVAFHIRWRDDFDGKPPQDEFVELAYQLNCLPIFFMVFGEAEKEKVEWLFDNRKTLVESVSKDSSDATEVESRLGDQHLKESFFELLNSSPSGFDMSIDYDWVTLILEDHDKEYAQPLFLEMMREGIPEAFRRAGVSWEGTENEEVVQLLKRRLRNVRSKLTGRYSDWKLEEEAYEIYQSLITVSPSEVGQVVPVERRHSNYSYEEPEGTVEELRDCFQEFGLKVQDRYQPDSHEVETIIDMIINQRFAFVFGGPLEERCEALLNASVGVFEPDVYVHPSGGNFRFVEVALDHCVYQFEIREDCNSPQMLFCDVFNHILERQRIEYRFAPTTGGDVYFAKPELLKELRDRFGARFEDGVEDYLPEN